jgi:hypothetical protein
MSPFGLVALLLIIAYIYSKRYLHRLVS